MVTFYIYLRYRNPYRKWNSPKLYRIQYSLSRSRYLGYEYLRILCSIPSLFSCESHARSARNNHAEGRISEVFPSCTNSDRDHVACRMCKSKGRRIGRSPERVLSRGTLIAVYVHICAIRQGRACCTRVYTRVHVQRGRERAREREPTDNCGP